MKLIIPMLAVLTLTACVQDHVDQRASHDPKYAKAQNHCNYEMRKADAASDKGGYVRYSAMGNLYRSCMAAQGYQSAK